MLDLTRWNLEDDAPVVLVECPRKDGPERIRNFHYDIYKHSVGGIFVFVGMTRESSSVTPARMVTGELAVLKSSSDNRFRGAVLNTQRISCTAL